MCWRGQGKHLPCLSRTCPVKKANLWKIAGGGPAGILSKRRKAAHAPLWLNSCKFMLKQTCASVFLFLGTRARTSVEWVGGWLCLADVIADAVADADSFTHSTKAESPACRFRGQRAIASSSIALSPFGCQVAIILELHAKKIFFIPAWSRLDRPPLEISGRIMTTNRL